MSVNVPADYASRVTEFIAELESLAVEADRPARVVINERTGTIVATARIKISNCAISQGNLIISIASTLEVSQPTAFSSTGRTVVTPKTDTGVNEAKANMIALPELPTVEKVATALNTLGVTPRDMMAIFQAMKQAGALQAELLIR